LDGTRWCHCGVELLQALARAEQVPLAAVCVSVTGTFDPSHPVRSDVNVFNSVRPAFTLEGVDPAQAAALIAGFKRR
jgi:hypothetical protein